MWYTRKISACLSESPLENFTSLKCLESQPPKLPVKCPDECSTPSKPPIDLHHSRRHHSRRHHPRGQSSPTHLCPSPSRNLARHCHRLIGEPLPLVGLNSALGSVEPKLLQPCGWTRRGRCLSGRLAEEEFGLGRVALASSRLWGWGPRRCLVGEPLAEGVFGLGGVAPASLLLSAEEAETGHPRHRGP